MTHAILRPDFFLTFDLQAKLKSNRAPAVILKQTEMIRVFRLQGAYQDVKLGESPQTDRILTAPPSSLLHRHPCHTSTAEHREVDFSAGGL